MLGIDLVESSFREPIKEKQHTNGIYKIYRTLSILNTQLTGRILPRKQERAFLGWTTTAIMVGESKISRIRGHKIIRVGCQLRTIVIAVRTDMPRIHIIHAQ